MFRPTGVLATQIAPPATAPLQGSRAFSLRASRGSLPPHALDMLAVRIGRLTAEDFHLIRCPALSAAHSYWAALMAARVVSDLRAPIGIVGQERRTCTDVELCSQHHIRGKTPLDEFFARAALAQRVVQLRLHGPKGGQGH